MCNNCYCESCYQCSARGFGSTGWCCERCENYDPARNCFGRFNTKLAETILTPEESQLTKILDLSIELEN